MKIQILISKNSWAQSYKKIILTSIKKFSKKPIILSNHLNLKKDYDINIIFSYFKIIPARYLKRSKFNIIPHESDLPKGKGMSPLTWQILENKKQIFFSLIEASDQVDSGKIYFKKKINIPKDFIFDEIKKKQLNVNLKLLSRFLKYYKSNKKNPRELKIKSKETFYKKRSPKDSMININKSIKLVKKQGYWKIFREEIIEKVY